MRGVVTYSVVIPAFAGVTICDVARAGAPDEA